MVAFVAGQTAPPGKRMGHAGAIISGGTGTAAEKMAAFEAAGVPVARIPSEIPGLIGRAAAAPPHAQEERQERRERRDEGEAGREAGRGEAREEGRGEAREEVRREAREEAGEEGGEEEVAAAARRPRAGGEPSARTNRALRGRPAAER